MPLRVIFSYTLIGHVCGKGKKETAFHLFLALKYWYRKLDSCSFVIIIQSVCKSPWNIITWRFWKVYIRSVRDGTFWIGFKQTEAILALLDIGHIGIGQKQYFDAFVPHQREKSNRLKVVLSTFFFQRVLPPETPRTVLHWNCEQPRENNLKDWMVICSDWSKVFYEWPVLGNEEKLRISQRLQRVIWMIVVMTTRRCNDFISDKLCAFNGLMPLKNFKTFV